MFLHLSVILFMGGGVSVQWGLCPGGVSVRGGSLLGRPPPLSGKERVVHIVLECILFFFFIPSAWQTSRCKVNKVTASSVTCDCTTPGHFALVTLDNFRVSFCNKPLEINITRKIQKVMII